MANVNLFTQPLDIGNRSLQMVGQRLITSMDPTVDQSNACTQVAECYDKLRVAELRRNNWVFSIKNVVLRAIGLQTMQLVPANWSQIKSYIIGSIVQYTNGEIYIATAPASVGAVPGSGPPWTQYFGPMTVSPWGANLQGEIPPAWSSLATYAEGDVVLGSDANTYVSIYNGNIDHNPVGDNGVNWNLNGTVQPTPWFAGELVYVPEGNSTARTGGEPSQGNVYLSLQTGNTDSIYGVQWDVTLAYNQNNGVYYNDVYYQSTTDLNIGNTPIAAWANATTYAMSANVLGTDGNLYTSVAGSNMGHNPVGDAGVHWTLLGQAWWVPKPATQVDAMMGQKWVQLGQANVQAIPMLWPFTSGPVEQSATRNAFMLPNGFLRKAPTSPKSGSASYLGAPSNILYDDWVFQSGFLISSQVDPVFLRFVADFADVFLMDPMFCEGLAGRIAIEVCEPLTQSDKKVAKVSRNYEEFMTEARLVNSIETGSEEPALDDWLQARY